jgi:hypothetical protein
MPKLILSVAGFRQQGRARRNGATRAAAARHALRDRRHARSRLNNGVRYLGARPLQRQSRRAPGVAPSGRPRSRASTGARSSRGLVYHNDPIILQQDRPGAARRARMTRTEVEPADRFVSCGTRSAVVGKPCCSQRALTLNEEAQAQRERPMPSVRGCNLPDDPLYDIRRHGCFGKQDDASRLPKASLAPRAVRLVTAARDMRAAPDSPGCAP